MAPIHLDLDELESDTEPSVEFTLDGRLWQCKPRGAIPSVIADALLGNVPIRIDGLYRGLLIETVERDGKPVNQADEFIELLSRSDSPFTLDRARQLSKTLVEAIFNRPTVPSTPSGRGRRTTAGTSKAASSSPGTRRKQRAG